MYSCHSQTMKPETREGKKKSRNAMSEMRNSRLSGGKSENFESFFYRLAKEADKLRISCLSEEAKNLSHKFDFHNISKSAFDPEKNGKSDAKPEILIRNPGKEEEKASAKIDFDVKIHVRIIMCSCHILCPSSKTTNIPGR